jgi:hypothetical protein
MPPPGSPDDASPAPPTQPPRRGRRPGRLPDPFLFDAIKSCTTWQECHRVLGQHEARLDAMLFSTLATQLVRTAERQGLLPDAGSGSCGGGKCSSAPSNNGRHSSSVSSSGGGGGGSGSGGALALPAEPPFWPSSAAAEAADRAGLDTCLARLCTAALPRLPGFRAAQFSNVLWALARLGHRPPSGWMEVFLSAVEARLVAFPARDLARVIWALGSLRYMPPPGWLGAFLSEAWEKAGYLQPRDLANTLWGLAVLRVQPPPLWLRDAALAMDGFFGTAQSGGSGTSGGPAGGARGSRAFEHSASEAAESMCGGGGDGASGSNGHGGSRLLPIQRFKPYELSISCWGLASLGAAPPAAWVEALAAEAETQLGSMGPREAAALLWALARWAMPLPPRALSGLLHGTLAALRRSPADGHALAVVLRATARLQQHPSATWARAALALAHAQWESMTARQVAAVAQAVAAMELPGPLPQPWVQGLEAASHAHLLQRCAQQREAAARTGWLPPAQHKAAQQERQRQRQQQVSAGNCEGTADEGANARDAAHFVWSMRRAGWRPADMWWRALYRACLGAPPGGSGALLRGATAADLATLLSSIAALRAPPPSAAWMDAFWARLSEIFGLSLASGGGGGAAAMPAAVLAAGASAPERGAAAWAPEAEAAAAALVTLLQEADAPEAAAAAGAAPVQSADASAILWAAASLDAHPPRPLLLALGAALARGLAALAGTALLRGLWGAVRLGLTAGTGRAGRELAARLVTRGWRRRTAMEAGRPRHRLFWLLEQLHGGQLPLDANSQLIEAAVLQAAPGAAQPLCAAGVA